MGHFDGFKRFRQSPDLVDLNQDGIGDPFLNPVGQTFGVGDEKIVANQLNLLAEFLCQHLPAVPIVFRHAVFNRQDWVFRNQIGEIFGIASGIQRLALAFQNVLSVLEVLRGGTIKRQHDIVTRLITGGFDSLHNVAQGVVGTFDRRGKTAFIAHVSIQTGFA